MGNTEFEPALEHRIRKGLRNKSNMVVILVIKVNATGLAQS